MPKHLTGLPGKNIFTFLALLFLILCSLHKDQDFVEYGTSVAVAVCTIGVSIFFAKKLSVIFGILSTYVLINASASNYFNYGRYFKLPQDVHNSLQHAGLHSIFELLIIFLLLTISDFKFLNGIKKALPVFTVFNATGVLIYAMSEIRWVQAYVGSYTFLIDYAGMNGCLLAASLSTILPGKEDSDSLYLLKIYGSVITIAATFLSHSAVPIGVLAVVLAYRYGAKWLMAPFVLAAPILGHHLLQSSQRFDAYRAFMPEWYKSPYRWFGSGLGTFKIFGPMIQQKVQFAVDAAGYGTYWFWMHSDYPLQSGLFELGIVGALLQAFLIIQVLLSLHFQREKELTGMFLGLLATATLNYPFRYFVTGFFCAYLVVYALRQNHHLRSAKRNFQISKASEI